MPVASPGRKESETPTVDGPDEKSKSWRISLVSIGTPLSSFVGRLCCLRELGTMGDGPLESEPLLLTSAKRNLKRTRNYFMGRIDVDDLVPLRRHQEDTVKHNKLSRKRQFIINELVETERKYVNRLGIMMEDFLRPLLELEPDCQPLKKLITQLELLKAFHSEFLEDLLATPSIPNVFCTKGDFLMLTSNYIKMHPKASSIIETLRDRNKAFGKLVDNCEHDYSCQLIALLIEPVQRIPRYQLLLRDLMAQTPKSHPELQALDDALKKIEGIVSKLNESQRDREAVNTMYSIYQRIRGRGSSLWVPSRKFIRKNVFWRVFQGDQFNKLPPVRVRCFLFSDTLIICEDAKIGRGYKFQDEINLSDVEGLDLLGVPHKNVRALAGEYHGFELSATGIRTVELYHTSHAVVNKWIELICRHKAKTKKAEESMGSAKARLSIPSTPLYARMKKNSSIGSLPALPRKGYQHSTIDLERTPGGGLITPNVPMSETTSYGGCSRTHTPPAVTTFPPPIIKEPVLKPSKISPHRKAPELDDLDLADRDFQWEVIDHGPYSLTPSPLISPHMGKSSLSHGPMMMSGLMTSLNKAKKLVGKKNDRNASARQNIFARMTEAGGGVFGGGAHKRGNQSTATVVIHKDDKDESVGSIPASLGSYEVSIAQNTATCFEPIVPLKSPTDMFGTYMPFNPLRDGKIESPSGYGFRRGEECREEEELPVSRPTSPPSPCDGLGDYRDLDALDSLSSTDASDFDEEAHGRVSVTSSEYIL